MSENTPIPEEEIQDNTLERIKENSAINMWGYSEKGIQAKQAAMTMLSTKNGMYARIPIICKADGCPYKESCMLLPYDLAPIGEYCPVEVAQVEKRCYEYYSDFDMDSGSFTDRCLVSEIVNCDVMLERTKALMANEQVPVIDVVTGISEQGTEYTHPEVSRYFDIWERLVERRNRLYSLMDATRKDKKTGNNSDGNKGNELLNLINAEGFDIVEERPAEFKDEKKE